MTANQALNVTWLRFSADHLVSPMKMLAPVTSACLLASLIGCGQSGSTASRLIKRQASDAVVPSHPLRARFLGEWQEDGETSFTIASSGGSEIVIESPSSPVWDTVINKVRFKGDELLFDQYMYYTGSEDFTMPGNPSVAHPYSGVRNVSVLSLVPDDRDRLRYTITTKHTPEPIEGFLVRASNGS